MKRFGKGDGGFTMLEIIAVIVVVAVLAAMAFSSMDRNDETVATARAIESQLRFAQLKAMSDVEEWGIQVTADSCTLMYNGIASTTVFMPGESTSIYNFPSGVTVSGGTGLIEFDYRGIPSVGGTELIADHSITVAGSPDETITITQITGFIQ